MTSLEYVKGYRAALRDACLDAERLIGAKTMNRIAKVAARNTAKWLKLRHDHAAELAEGKEPELWVSPEGALFYRTKKDEEGNKEE